MTAAGFVIDQASGVAPYEQLRLQVLGAIDAGDLVVGGKLPTVRGLAAELGLAVNTVAKAFRALEQDGVIETRGRHGSFVAARDAPHEELRRAALAYAATAHRLGIPAPEALAVAAEALTPR